MPCRGQFGVVQAGLLRCPRGGRAMSFSSGHASPAGGAVSANAPELTLNAMRQKRGRNAPWRRRSDTIPLGRTAGFPVSWDVRRRDPTKRSGIVSPSVRSWRCVRAETTVFDVIPLTAVGTRRDNSRPRQRRDTAAFMAATVCDTIASTPNIPNFAVDLVGSP
jgi:hypothetical protein